MIDGQVIIGGIILYIFGVIGMLNLMDAAIEGAPPPLCILLAIAWPVAVPLFGYVLISKSIIIVLKSDK